MFFRIRAMGKGGSDTMWCFSVALGPVGLALIVCAATIQPYQGMTPQIQIFLTLMGIVAILIFVGIQIALRYFYYIDTDQVTVDVKRTMRERKRMARRREKRKNIKLALQITIPGFTDVKIRPKLEDISDSDGDDSGDDGEDDPEAKW